MPHSAQTNPATTSTSRGLPVIVRPTVIAAVFAILHLSSDYITDQAAASSAKQRTSARGSFRAAYQCARAGAQARARQSIRALRRIASGRGSQSNCTAERDERGFDRSHLSTSRSFGFTPHDIFLYQVPNPCTHIWEYEPAAAALRPVAVGAVIAMQIRIFADELTRMRKDRCVCGNMC
jgi:hypothetical protein